MLTLEVNLLWPSCFLFKDGTLELTYTGATSKVIFFYRSTTYFKPEKRQRRFTTVKMLKTITKKNKAPQSGSTAHNLKLKNETL